MSASDDLTIDAILHSMDMHELQSGRSDLYVPAEAHRDTPVTWEHYHRDGTLAWVKTLSATAYRLWRQRGFK